MDVTFYIDGFNLYFGALKGTPYKWLDVGAVCDALAPGDQVTKIYYFTAPVGPTLEDASNKANERQQVYWRALKLDSRIEIVQGAFRTEKKWQPLVDEPWTEVTRPKLRPAPLVNLIERIARSRMERVAKAHVYRTEEKRSDVNLGAYLLRDVYTGGLQKAVLVTNDSDLRAPIEFAIHNGATVGVVSPARNGTINRELRVRASFSRSLRESALQQCQLQNELVGPKGQRISKPNIWKSK